MHMLKLNNNETTHSTKASVTHLASQVGCSVAVSRTVEAAGIAVAEMSSVEGLVETFVRKISF